LGRQRAAETRQAKTALAPPERPNEAAEGSPFTETWEFRAIVAEAMTAAVIQSMPRMIVAALTGNSS
jgi:hypothetical protein